MKKISIILFFAYLILTGANAQETKKLAVYAGGFYNWENLFDTENDPNNEGDDDFTPRSKYRWTEEKYKQKVRNISSTIALLARETCPTGPAFLAISEIENSKVIEDVIHDAPLAGIGYKYVHYDSPDLRGIDVALIYNPKLFKVISSYPYPYTFPGRPDFKTRDILIVSGIMAGEPFHVIVGHWPSRYGGKKSSVFRERAAEITRHIVDSIRTKDADAKIMITGDFNDDPIDVSCKEILQAKRRAEDTSNDDLFNTTWPLYDKGIGSLCYQGQWNLYDQIIISGNLLGNDRTTLKYWKNEIFNRDFLFEQEGKRKGYPLRTFSGRRFQNGYSDHLPSLIYFVKEIDTTQEEDYQK